jgi:hypothetical protein
MENEYKKVLEYLNAESKKGADRKDSILDLRRYFASKGQSVCIVGDHDEVFAAICAYERCSSVTWLSNNDKFDWFIDQVSELSRYNVDTLGCLELFVKPHDVVIIQMNVAVNHAYPARIVSRFLNMARSKAYIFNSYNAFNTEGEVVESKSIFQQVKEMNSDKYEVKRNIQRSNGWTEFERKNPVTDKRFDIL